MKKILFAFLFLLSPLVSSAFEIQNISVPTNVESLDTIWNISGDCIDPDPLQCDNNYVFVFAPNRPTIIMGDSSLENNLSLNEMDFRSCGFGDIPETGVYKVIIVPVEGGDNVQYDCETDDYTYLVNTYPQYVYDVYVGMGGNPAQKNLNSAMKAGLNLILIAFAIWFGVKMVSATIDVTSVEVANEIKRDRRHKKKMAKIKEERGLL